MAEWGFIQRRICGSREIEGFPRGGLGLIGVLKKLKG